MARPSKQPPKYRLKLNHGYELACVTLHDAATRRRRDVYLGRYGTPESRQAYHRTVAEWEARGRRLDPGRASQNRIDERLTVTELCAAFLRWFQGEGYSASHVAVARSAIRALRTLYGATAAEEFGPRALAAVRQQMLAGDARLRLKQKQPSVAQRMARLIVRIFRWGAGMELVAAATADALDKLPPLRLAGLKRSRVKPVPEAYVEATKPYAAPQVRAMIELQALTGMRPGEVVLMRSADVDTRGKVWIYRPQHHKTAHLDLTREICLGPRAQDVLRPWLRPNIQEYLFRPHEVVDRLRRERAAQRSTPAGRGNERGNERGAAPRRQPGERYTASSYRKAVQSACDAADRQARGNLGQFACPRCAETFMRHASWRRHCREQHEMLDLPRVEAAERIIHRWHPNQLRHNWGTAVRARFGAEGAQVALGHESIDTTLIYAERDLEFAQRIALQMG
ncbi:MAG: site-specific integrase [Phycisphaerae bacterium]|jgi:integrase